MLEELRELVSSRWALSAGGVLCPFLRAAGLPVSVETLVYCGPFISNSIAWFLCTQFPLGLGSLALSQSVEEDRIVFPKVWAHTVKWLCTSFSLTWVGPVTLMWIGCPLRSSQL